MSYSFKIASKKFSMFTRLEKKVVKFWPNSNIFPGFCYVDGFVFEPLCKIFTQAMHTDNPLSLKFHLSLF